MGRRGQLNRGRCDERVLCFKTSRHPSLSCVPGHVVPVSMDRRTAGSTRAAFAVFVAAHDRSLAWERFEDTRLDTLRGVDATVDARAAAMTVRPCWYTRRGEDWDILTFIEQAKRRLRPSPSDAPLDPRRHFVHCSRR